MVVLAGAGQILLLGPSVTKLHFLHWVRKHDPTLEPRIIGIETADHPSDRQLVAHVRQYFRDPSPAAASHRSDGLSVGNAVRIVGVVRHIRHLRVV